MKLVLIILFLLVCMMAFGSIPRPEPRLIAPEPQLTKLDQKKFEKLREEALRKLRFQVELRK